MAFILSDITGVALNVMDVCVSVHGVHWKTLLTILSGQERDVNKL